MKIRMLVTADYATLDSGNGKVHILGIFTRISTKAFPYRHPRMVVVVRLAPDDLTETTAQRNFDLVLSDADGTELLQASHLVQIPRDPQGNRVDANVLLELNLLEFPHPGLYEFAVYIDGEKLDDTSIELVQRN